MEERILNFECSDLRMGRGAMLGIWVLPLCIGPWTSLLLWASISTSDKKNYLFLLYLPMVMVRGFIR